MRFEDLEIWQEARKLVKDIFAVTSQESFKGDLILKEHLRKSAISVTSNIAEGFGRGGNKEFIQFLFIANGSLMELQSQLYNSLGCRYLNKEDFQILYDNCEKISRMILNFIKSLRKSKYKGIKYKTENGEL